MDFYQSVGLMRTIGILGGMGPVATGEFILRILALCQKGHGAVQDGEYPAIAMYSMSPKGSNESGIKANNLLEREFLAGVKELDKTSADFITIPCNTAHHYIESMRNVAKVPIISITEETVKRAKRLGMKRIGLFASESTYKEGVYGKPFSASGIIFVEPTELEKKGLTRLVLHVMGGTLTPKDKLYLKKLIKRMKKDDGIDAAIIGCTELSCVLRGKEYPMKAIDAMDVLAEEAVKNAYK